MEAHSRKRIRLRLRGIVQGVGFRPLVYNLAKRHVVTGYVLNSSAGLTAEAEGNAEAVDAFLHDVTTAPPPLAWIQEVEIAEIPVTGDDTFVIRPSLAETGEFALISADVATCADCFRDFTTAGNRRYQYPFTNCTNCGPRYTIVRDIPYDRPNTTMAAFPLCAACLAEYQDPANRRFHAQPNACPVCGPQLSARIGEARRRLAAGQIVALRGLGGFHLACDARNEAAVCRLRTRKRRSEKPFALMCRDMTAVEEICLVTDAERCLLEGVRHPIVVLERQPQAGIPEAVAPGNPTLGVMLPYTPLHHLLFQDAAYTALVMTSGNISEEPIVIANEEAVERLSGIADWFLLHNREIHMRVDDSVTRVLAGAPRVLRRSRGFVPQTVELGTAMPELLACGGELKNTLCLTKGRHAILSQHIGDMENYETLLFFEETLGNLKKLFRVEPRAVAYDLHPGYLSTKYALALPLEQKIGVQHHHAHIAACMAENGLVGEVIGVALDGTGYGLDGNIWGGEFLLARYDGFARRAHFRYVALPGGDAAVREPWRSGLSYRLDALGVTALEIPPGVTETNFRVVHRMLETGMHTVQTSSCGRLFDAVASLIGLRQQITFEGQAAIELEMIADPAEGGRYGYEIGSGEVWEVDYRPAIAELIGDVHKSVPPPILAARFHNTVTAAIVATCMRLRAETGVTRVCLSGGSFQNRRLVEHTVRNLDAAGFEIFLHTQVPPNDGGIALGQAAVAAAHLQS